MPKPKSPPSNARRIMSATIFLFIISGLISRIDTGTPCGGSIRNPAIADSEEDGTTDLAESRDPYGLNSRKFLPGLFGEPKPRPIPRGG
jgi:hypothetical protein